MVFGTQLELLDLTGKCSLHLLYHCIFVHSTTTHVLSCYLILYYWVTTVFAGDLLRLFVCLLWLL